MKIFTTINSPIGFLTIACENGFITDVVFGADFPDGEIGSSPLLDTAVSQLNEYFAGARKTFDLPIRLYGTEFQKHVWNELQKIPYGETISYKTLAKRVGNEKACRAVGMANNKNPIPIIIIFIHFILAH